MTAQVSQGPVLVLAEDEDRAPRLSFGAVLVLAAPGAPCQVSQATVLVLARRIGRRIFAHIDTGYAE